MSDAAIVSVNASHGRPRVELRRPSDGGTPPLPPTAPTVPFQDPVTGRITDGREARRRRTVKARAKGVSTLNPERCEPWLAPHVRAGAAHGVELLGRFTDPALGALVGATADAHTVFRALLSQGAAGDAKALTEAKAWLREYRACMRELAALAGLVSGRADDDSHLFVDEPEVGAR